MEYKDYNYLHENYIIEERSTFNIAKEFGVTAGTIRYWLIKHGFSIRGQSESWVIGNRKEHFKQTMRKYLDDSEWVKYNGECVSKAKKGVPMTEEHKQALRDKWASGTRKKAVLSEEGRERLRLAGKKRIGRKLTEAQRKKLSIAHIGIQAGDKHPNWKGGVSKIQRAPGFTKELKKRVYKRDNWDCQDCGKHGRLIHAHHVDFNKDNHDIDNLITLCPKCHGKRHRNHQLL